MAQIYSLFSLTLQQKAEICYIKLYIESSYWYTIKLQNSNQKATPEFILAKYISINRAASGMNEPCG
jgi:hypothetical protein